MWACEHLRASPETDDCSTVAASALGAVVMMRNLIAAVFPLFTVDVCGNTPRPALLLLTSSPWLAQMFKNVSPSLYGKGHPLTQAFASKLGNQWATFLVAFLACLLVPIPFFLYHYGRRVRAQSPYCREHFDDE